MCHYNALRDELFFALISVFCLKWKTFINSPFFLNIWYFGHQKVFPLYHHRKIYDFITLNSVSNPYFSIFNISSDNRAYADIIRNSYHPCGKQIFRIYPLPIITPDSLSLSCITSSPSTKTGSIPIIRAIYNCSCVWSPQSIT